MQKSPLLLLVVLLLWALTSGAFAQNPNPSAAIDAEIQSIMSGRHLPGVSTLVVKDGEIVWMQSYGYANTDAEAPYTDTTSQMIASISKVFTGMAIMQLYEQGLMDLDEDINNYLPFEVKIPGYENEPITFRMLLTHTSSIKDGNALDGYYNWNGDPTITLADCMQRYYSVDGQDYNPNNNFVNHPPGSVYKYSNIAVALEGYLVELISGMPFSAYCEEHIFAPLCMSNTHWFLAEYQDLNMLANPHDYSGGQYEPIPHYGFADYPDGLLHTNVRDMANFMIAVLQGGMLQNSQIISAASLDDMFTPQVPSLDPTQGLQFYQEVFNVSSGSIELWGHSGGEYGISTEMYFDRDNDMGIAVFANGENLAVEIVELLYDYGLSLSPSGVGNPACGTVAAAEALQEKWHCSVFPNPASSRLTFFIEGLGKEQCEISLLNLWGEQVMNVWTQESEVSLDLNHLPKGLYMYTLRCGSRIASGKVLVQ